MDKRVSISIAILIPLLLTCLGVLGVLFVWRSMHAEADVALRVPGEDQRPAKQAPVQTVLLTGKLTQFTGKPSELPGTWTRFRGESFDNVSVALNPVSVDLAETWPESGPPQLWTIDVGEGFSGASIYQGCVYFMDYDRDAEEESIRCVSLDTGEDIWKYAYPIKIKRWHGMSRTVPTVTDDYIVAMGSKCHVTCLSTKTGELLWNLDLVADYGTTVPQWYTSQCPLVEDGKAIIAPGGTCPGHGRGL